MEEYYKINKNGISYYIREAVYDNFKVSKDSPPLELVKCSDFILNTKSNTIIKCRFDISDILENLVKEVIE